MASLEKIRKALKAGSDKVRKMDASDKAAKSAAELAIKKKSKETKRMAKYLNMSESAYDDMAKNSPKELADLVDTKRTSYVMKKMKEKNAPKPQFQHGPDDSGSNAPINTNTGGQSVKEGVIDRKVKTKTSTSPQVYPVQRESNIKREKSAVSQHKPLTESKPKKPNPGNVQPKATQKGSLLNWVGKDAEMSDEYIKQQKRLKDNTMREGNVDKDTLKKVAGVGALGAGGVATGSINVITLNMNRLIQQGANIKEEVQKIHKYQVAYRKLIEDYEESGLLPVYKAGFISLDKQFLTIGINGMVEAAESQGIHVSNNDTYKKFVNKYLKVIYDENKLAKKEYGYMFNTEFVPAENLGVKNAKWDRADGLFVPRDCYNSYFYVVEDNETNTLDKIVLHGNENIQYLDGGSALHLNLEETPNKDGFVNLLHATATAGCNYFCFNIKVTICNDCSHINKQTLQKCSECGSVDVDHATRVIGYLKRVSSFSSKRQVEHDLRHYHVKPPSDSLGKNRVCTFANHQKPKESVFDKTLYSD